MNVNYQLRLVRDLPLTFGARQPRIIVVRANTIVIQLICLDVDGTLVGTRGVIHPRVWTAATQARAAGIRLAVSSGRPGFGSARDLAVRLEPLGWHVFQNGASVLRLPSGPSLSSPIEPALIQTLIARARASEITLELYSDSDYAVERVSDRARAHADLLGVPFAPRRLESLEGPIVRAQWLVSPADAALLETEPHPGLEITTSTSPVMPDTRFMNITAAGVDKARAVRSVADEYGVCLADVMFVGDGRNDIGAMRIVGYAVAMGNADPEVQAVARVRVSDVDAGGAAEAMERATQVA